MAPGLPFTSLLHSELAFLDGGSAPVSLFGTSLSGFPGADDPRGCPLPGVHSCLSEEDTCSTRHCQEMHVRPTGRCYCHCQNGCHHQVHNDQRRKNAGEGNRHPRQHCPWARPRWKRCGGSSDITAGAATHTTQQCHSWGCSQEMKNPSWERDMHSSGTSKSPETAASEGSWVDGQRRGAWTQRVSLRQEAGNYHW